MVRLFLTTVFESFSDKMNKSGQFNTSGDSKLIETIWEVLMSIKVFILVLAIDINPFMMAFLINFPILMNITMRLCIVAIFLEPTVESG